MKRWKIAELALLLALCLSALTGTWCAGKQEALSHKLIRLHVLAQSDSPAHQAAKLRAREAVLARLTPALETAASREEAAEIIGAMAPELAGAAAGAAGVRVRLELGREHYPLRHYGDFALPAGEYLSLRLLLGEGEGRNWWCVVYPPLCMASAAESAAAFGEEDWRLISEEEGAYEIRFRLLELWGELTGRFSG